MENKTKYQWKILLTVIAVTIMVAILIVNNRINEQQENEKIAEQNQENVTEMEAESVISIETADAETAEDAEEKTSDMVEINGKQVLFDYAARYEANDEFLGWIRIDDTNVDYPVMHTPNDPEKYLHKDFDGKYSFAGVPFVDANCTAESDNLLIYGHNMKNGTMFHDILKYKDQEFWEKNPVIYFDTIEEKQEYEVLAAFYDRIYYQNETCFKFYKFIDAEDQAEFDNAITQFKNKAIYDTEVEAQYGEQLITLITCSSYTDNGRFVVVAVKKNSIE